MEKQFTMKVTEDEKGEITFKIKMEGCSNYQAFGFLTYVRNRVEEKMMKLKFKEDEETQKA